MTKLPKFFTTVTAFSKALALFMLIVFPIIGFYLGTLYKQSTVVSTQNSNTASNLKTYVNSSDKYSFQYPSDWTIEKNCVGGLTNDSYICLKSPDLQLNPVPSVDKGLLITIASNGSSMFVGGNQSPSDFCKPSGLDKITSCTETNINGIRAIKKVFSNYPFIDVALIKNGQIVYIIRLEYSSEISQSFDTFDQILASFKLQ